MTDILSILARASKAANETARKGKDWTADLAAARLSRYPDAEEVKPYHPQGTDAVAYEWDKRDPNLRRVWHYLLMFRGRSTKPFLYRRYDTALKREDDVQAAVAGEQGLVTRKVERKQSAKAAVSKVKPGDIFYTSYGYDETHVSFYEVGTVSGASAVVYGIGKHREPSSATYVKVSPIPGDRHGSGIRVRLSGEAFKVKGQYATRWPGYPVTESH